MAKGIKVGRGALGCRAMSVLADVIPFLGDMLAMGSFVLALPVSLCFLLVTIAIAWIAFRPLIGIPLLVVGLAVMLIPMLRRRRMQTGPVA